MRLRKFIFKIVILLAVFLLFLFIFLNNSEKETNPDEFLTILRNTKEDVDVTSPARKQQQFIQKSLLNLTNFEYLIDNDSCENYKKELMGMF